VAPPFRVVELDIMYGQGISRAGELLDLGQKAGLVEKAGAWLSLDSQRLGQGRENAKLYLEQHPDLADRLAQKLREQAGLDLLAHDPGGE
jgi:recombination protein RecA